MSDLQPRVSVAKIVAKGAMSNLPVIGGIINEIITELIPDRRVERLNDLLESLEQRIAKLEPTPARESWTEPVFVDLLEDGFVQAARAGSTDRIEHIAAVVSGGLGANRARMIERKFLSDLLGQLNDVEVLLVMLAGEESQGVHQAFYELHGQAVARPHPAMSDPAPEHERAAIFAGYDKHLEMLGLLETAVAPIKKGEVPKFDRKGRLQGARLWISPLGRAFLLAIDQPCELDREPTKP